MIRIAVLDDYQHVASQMVAWDILPQSTELRIFEDHLADTGRLVERLRGFHIICGMRERTPFPKELLQQLPDLRLLITTGSRNASFDVEAATELGILVCGTRGLGHPTAELTWGLILDLTKRIHLEDSAVRRGRWQTGLCDDLNGRTLGLMGLGRLGSRVAAVGRAFEMNIIAWSQNLTSDRATEHGATLVSREDLLRNSDILSIHLVLSERTCGLIGRQELSLMKPTSVLINTSRGPIVDEAALVDALANGTIAGAALDVFDEEPLPSNHALISLENTVLTPHIGYVSRPTYQVFFHDMVEDIVAYLKGKPVRVINPRVLETDAGRVAGA